MSSIIKEKETKSKQGGQILIEKHSFIVEELMRKNLKLQIQNMTSTINEVSRSIILLKNFLILYKNENNVDVKGKYLKVLELELEGLDFISSEIKNLLKPSVKWYKSVSVQQLVNEVKSWIFPMIHNNIVDFKLSYPDHPVFLFCNDYQIKQVLLHLIKNGVEALAYDGIIKLKIISYDHCIAIFIKDNGCGLTQQTIDNLGTPFYSTKEKGNGIGLVLCSKIIEEHGGMIFVNSKEGIGTNFCIVMPHE